MLNKPRICYCEKNLNQFYMIVLVYLQLQYGGGGSKKDKVLNQHLLLSKLQMVLP